MAAQARRDRQLFLPQCIGPCVDILVIATLTERDSQPSVNLTGHVAMLQEFRHHLSRRDVKIAVSPLADKGNLLTHGTRSR
jgi:hypothetical protein